MNRAHWDALARRRILRVLGTYSVCSQRTLENKVADAGPMQMRVHPHVITGALRQLRESNSVLRFKRPTGHWYALPQIDPATLKARLAELEPIQQALGEKTFTLLVGQALEIAIYRAIAATATLDVFGTFEGLEDHGDDLLYRKEEPPSTFRNKYLASGKLDFLVISGENRVAGGIEVKNAREWMYPNRREVTELLRKCCTLDIVPILIARRIHYTTTRLFVPRGGLIRETYFQRLLPQRPSWLNAQRTNTYWAITTSAWVTNQMIRCSGLRRSCHRSCQKPDQNSTPAAAKPLARSHKGKSLLKPWVLASEPSLSVIPWDRGRGPCGVGRRPKPRWEAGSACSCDGLSTLRTGLPVQPRPPPIQQPEVPSFSN